MDTATVRRELVEVCPRNRPYTTYIFTHSLVQVCISLSLFPNLIIIIMIIIIIIIIIIIPVITGATGIVTRSLRKNLEAVPRKHSKDSLQKTAILGTSHIIRKVLQCEASSLSCGDHRWFKISTRKKRPVTRDIHIV